MNKRTVNTLIFVLAFGSGLLAQSWDERPVYSMKTVYEQDFTTGAWDGTTF